MLTHNWEDWAMGLSIVGAAALAVSLSSTPTPSFTTQAVAAEKAGPSYVMTITSRRLPAECKGLSEASMPAHCAAILNGQTISVRANR